MLFSNVKLANFYFTTALFAGRTVMLIAATGTESTMTSIIAKIVVPAVLATVFACRTIFVAGHYGYRPLR